MIGSELSDPGEFFRELQEDSANEDQALETLNNVPSTIPQPEYSPHSSRYGRTRKRAINSNVVS